MLGYFLVLSSKQTGVFINISLGANETEVILGPQDGLEEDQKCVYAAAVNSIRTTSTRQYGMIHAYVSMLIYIHLFIDTSDVQAVNATVVGESSVDIQCWFIHGSDALGCKMVLVSDCPNITDVPFKE